MEEIVEVAHYDWENTETVFTDFYNYNPEFDVKLKESDTVSLMTSNYDEYTLFCFNTKMTEKLGDIGHRLNTKHYKDKNYLCVVLYDGATEIPIDLETKKMLEIYTKECMKKSEKCLLFS